MKRGTSEEVAPDPKKGSGSYMRGANGVPKMGDDRTLHLGLKAGELASRIVSVGSLSRAQRLRQCLDDPGAAFELTSSRGFTTFTGTMGGVPVSVRVARLRGSNPGLNLVSLMFSPPPAQIVAIGMGAPMMDFFVREARAVTQGSLVIARYGSCGGLSDEMLPGNIALNTSGSVSLRRNYDAFTAAASPESPSTGPDAAYEISRPVAPDTALAKSIQEHLTEALSGQVFEGLNVSCDSFYGSQGRVDEQFEDRNDALLAQVTKLDAISMEMESFQLLHLAACSKGSIRACTSAIVAANRKTGDAITNDVLRERETVGGRAILRAVASVAMD